MRKNERRRERTKANNIWMINSQNYEEHFIIQIVDSISSRCDLVWATNCVCIRCVLTVDIERAACVKYNQPAKYKCKSYKAIKHNIIIIIIISQTKNKHNSATHKRMLMHHIATTLHFISFHLVSCCCCCSTVPFA